MGGVKKRYERKSGGGRGDPSCTPSPRDAGELYMSGVGFGYVALVLCKQHQLDEHDYCC